MRTALAFAIFLAIVLFLAVPATGAFAANTGNDIRLLNPLKAASFGDLLKDLLKIVVEVGTVVVVLMLIYVGFLFVTAQGNESKLTRAKEALLWTLVGALILLGAQAIATGIQATVQSLS